MKEIVRQSRSGLYYHYIVNAVVHWGTIVYKTLKVSMWCPMFIVRMTSCSCEVQAFSTNGAYPFNLYIKYTSKTHMSWILRPFGSCTVVAMQSATNLGEKECICATTFQFELHSRGFALHTGLSVAIHCSRVFEALCKLSVDGGCWCWQVWWLLDIKSVHYSNILYHFWMIATK